MFRVNGSARHLVRVGAVVVVSIIGLRQAQAQVPGAPVLQNAFANPGLAFAANFGTGSGQSFFGAAAGWGLGGGRLMVSGAAGVQRANEARRGAYGGRLSATAWTSAGGGLAAGAFVGIGGAPRTKDAAGLENNPAVMSVPVGISIGYRRALGSRGLSIYGSPLYRWTRAEINDVSTSSGNIGGAVGVDFGLTRSIGFTAGAEFGKGDDGGTGSLFGFAVSFVPGR